jgi:hypothetical protein
MSNMRYYSNQGLGALLLIGAAGAVQFLGTFGGDLSGAECQLVATDFKEDGSFNVVRLRYPSVAADAWPKPALEPEPAGTGKVTFTDVAATLDLELDRSVLGQGDVQFSPPPPPTFKTTIILNRQV